MIFVGYLAVFVSYLPDFNYFPWRWFLSIILHWFLWAITWFQLLSPGKNLKIERRNQNMENNYILVGCVNDFRLFVVVLIFNYFIFLTRIITHVKFFFQFSYVETVLCAIGDEFPHILRKRRNNIIFRAIVIGITFLLGLPMVCNVSRN